MFKEIVVLVGMPRSGTSWLSQILESCPDVRFRLSPLFSYALKNVVDERSTAEAYLEMFQRAYELEDEFMTQSKNRQDGHYPMFAERGEAPPVLAIKMTRFHNLIETMMNKVPNLKFVSIVRHPCGAIASWVNTPKEFPAGADVMAEWRSGACRNTGPEEFWGFDNWVKVTKLHTSLEHDFPDRFRIVRYEALVERPMEQTRDLFAFLNLPFSRQTEQFLIDCHTKHDSDTHAVYKDPAVKDKWRETLPAAIQQEIVGELQGTELARFLC